MSDTTKNPGGRPRRGVVAGKIAASAIDENATDTLTPEEAEAAHIEPTDAGEAIVEPLTPEEVRAQVKAELLAEMRAEEEATRLAAIADAPPEAEVITVHFVRDGFTLLGEIRYSGQTVSIVRGSEEWDRTLVQGRSILDYDVYEQERIYKAEYFRPGPWRGKGFDVSDPTLTEEERVVLARANGGSYTPNTKPAAPSFLSSPAN